MSLTLTVYRVEMILDESKLVITVGWFIAYRNRKAVQNALHIISAIIGASLLTA